jgi:spore germination cell wall hydrolase CwlJ-like protein
MLRASVTHIETQQRRLKFEMKALVRGNHSLFKAAIAATVVVTSIFSASLASAADEAVSELKPGLYVYKSGRIGMAPIANNGVAVPLTIKAADTAAVATATVALVRATVPELVSDSDTIPPVAKLSDKDEHCLATAIYFEARGESVKGQTAVAEVVVARTRVPGRPKTVCGVVYEGSHRRSGCQFSFTCDRAKDVVNNREQWSVAKRVAEDVLSSGGAPSVSRGATFYHADYVKPRWARRMVRVTQIGSHIFYKPKRGRLL